jgi:hypothetical protein
MPHEDGVQSSHGSREALRLEDADVEVDNRQPTTDDKPESVNLR